MISTEQIILVGVGGVVVLLTCLFLLLFYPRLKKLTIRKKSEVPMQQGTYVNYKESEETTEDRTLARELIFESIIREYELGFVRLRHLDNKATNLVSVSGIVLGLLTGVGGLFLTSSSQQIDLSNISTIILLWEIFFFVISLTFGLLSLRIRYYVHFYISTEDFDKYRGMSKNNILEILHKGYANAVQRNGKVSNEKMDAINRSFSFLYLGIILLFVFGLSLIFA
ncbi:MAG: hypothetical protein NWE91_02300 [Candidatus Bathyarchaeota archaeon]|nr:hypothetical protein [Candidatus Bathyarchaeota archaeon]